MFWFGFKEFWTYLIQLGEEWLRVLSLYSVLVSQIKSSLSRSPLFYSLLLSLLLLCPENSLLLIHPQWIYSHSSLFTLPFVQKSKKPSPFSLFESSLHLDSVYLWILDFLFLCTKANFYNNFWNSLPTEYYFCCLKKYIYIYSLRMNRE